MIKEILYISEFSSDCRLILIDNKMTSIFCLYFRAAFIIQNNIPGLECICDFSSIFCCQTNTLFFINAQIFWYRNQIIPFALHLLIKLIARPLSTWSLTHNWKKGDIHIDRVRMCWTACHISVVIKHCQVMQQSGHYIHREFHVKLKKIKLKCLNIVPGSGRGKVWTVTIMNRSTGKSNQEV